MKTGPVIRIATVNDAAEVSRLLKSAMLTYCADSGISSSMLEAMTESVESVADRIIRQTCLVAESDGKIVGSICLKRVENPIIYNFSDKTLSFLEKAGPSYYKISSQKLWTWHAKTEQSVSFSTLLPRIRTWLNSMVKEDLYLSILKTQEAIREAFLPILHSDQIVFETNTSQPEIAGLSLMVL